MQFLAKKQLSRGHLFDFVTLNLLFLPSRYHAKLIFFLHDTFPSNLQSFPFFYLIKRQRCHHAQTQSDYSSVFEGSGVHQHSSY